MAAQPHQVDSMTVLDDLVGQFSDPMAFLRELIQNAIDAGSGEVDIRVEFEPEGVGEQGVMVVHIDDFGEGMTREIIETKLTRLFSSGKDDDFTKIGRFGIGFVSVFAVRPDAVCVDTGRAGEYWRVLFRADRTFDLIALDSPVEGTQIQVIKPVTAQEFERFAARTREVVTFWCKHVHAPIFVNGERMNQPFDLEALVKVTHQEEGTRLVAGLIPSAQAPYGYYNRGLTLKEGEQSPWPHVAIKVDSRYLEHTLTRDQILEDRHFHKAMRLMELAAQERLPAELMAQLEQAAARWPAQPQLYEALSGLLLGLASTYVQIKAKRRDHAPILPTLYEAPLSLHECARRLSRGREVYLAHARTHLTEAMRERALLLALTPAHPMTTLLSLYVGRPLERLEPSFVLPRPSGASNRPGVSALSEEVLALTRRLGGRLSWVGVAHLDDEGSPVRGQLALLTQDRAAVLPAERALALGLTTLLEQEQLVLNVDDERIDQLIVVAQREPEWAALALIKLIALHQGLPSPQDEALTTAALERRLKRRGEPAAQPTRPT